MDERGVVPLVGNFLTIDHLGHSGGNYILRPLDSARERKYHKGVIEKKNEVKVRGPEKVYAFFAEN